MRKATLATFFMTLMTLMVLGLGCRGEKNGQYELHIGETYFISEGIPHMAGWGLNIVEYYLEVGDEFQFQGIYVEEPPGQLGFVRLFEHEDGWTFVRLTNLLPVEQGSIIDIRGTVVHRERIRSGFRKTGGVQRLEVDNHQVIYDTAALLKKAQQEYRNIRGELQEKIADRGSKLVLSATPYWRVDWCPKDDVIVVVAQSHDPMCTVETQFIFNKTSQQLKTVYLREWPKTQ
jgi:hypothetical protein